MEQHATTAPPSGMEPATLETPQAAAFLGVSASWLNKDRTSDRPPVVPFTKLGRRVVYSTAVLRRIVEGR